MAEYYAVLKKAIGGLDSGSAETRRAVYDKARNALIGQLKAIDPPLAASEISRQRLELEEAIRRVERETTAGGGMAPRPSRPPEPPQAPAVAAEAPPPPPPPSPPPQAPSARSPQDVFRRAIQEAESRNAQPAPERLQRSTPAPAYTPPVSETRSAASWIQQRTEPPRPEPRAPEPAPEIAPEVPPAYDVPHYEPPRHEAPRPVRDQGPVGASADPYIDPRDRPARAVPKRKGFLEEQDSREAMEAPARRSRLPTILLVVLILGMIGGLGALAWSQRTILSDLLAGIDNSGTSETAGSQGAPPTLSEPRPEDRVPQADSGEPVRSAGEPTQPSAQDPIADTIANAPETAPPPPPAAGNVPPVAQRAVLYEEPLDAATAAAGVTAINGVTTWAFNQNGPNGPEVVANLDVPDRKLKIRLSIRRNTDSSLPASHLVEAVVTTPPDFPGKAVRGIPRLVLKTAEDERGQPLVGAAAKVADGFFWIALSSTPADVAQNLQLLRERTWIDLPIVYETGQRAILTFEKGTPGQRAFDQAFAAWGTG